jgi:CHAT domain-containing protein
LPIHAAGDYRQSSQARAKIFDYAVSSYTPNLSSLTKFSAEKANVFHGLLAISQPVTEGLGPLPGTLAEVRKIQEQVGNARFTWLNGDEATVDTVVQAMDEYSWIHLACHGVQNQTEPTKSAFALHDGNLSLETISQKSLRSAKLAFLSACQTASGDESLPEEAVHLAAGMLIAGYDSVLATMWSISDKHAPIVAEEVYKQLLLEKETNNGQVAYALHNAVTLLRKTVGEDAFLTWIPFIHLGI